MSNDTSRRFERVKQKIQQIQSEKDKAEGALDEPQKKMKEIYGCQNIEELRKLQEKLVMEVEEIQERFTDRLSKLEDILGSENE